MIDPLMAKERLLLRWLVFAISIASVGFGVAMMVRAELGVSPNDVLNTGISSVAGLSVGLASWITAATAMLISWMMGRRPLLPTVLGGVIVGVTINIGLAVLPTFEALPVRIALMSVGLIVLWVAITGVVAPNIGAGPLELIMLALLDRRVSIRNARWGIESTLLILGVILGGSIGAGTLLFATLSGPVLSQTLPVASRLLGTRLTNVDHDAAAIGSHA